MEWNKSSKIETLFKERDETKLQKSIYIYYIFEISHLTLCLAHLLALLYYSTIKCFYEVCTCFIAKVIYVVSNNLQGLQDECS